MKKNVLYTVMLSLLSSVSAYAMGLGDIKVTSNLDQPFSADIELIDVGNVPLSGIKVNLASAEDFERVGLERAYALSLLNFSVEKHANGKAFIKVSSIERITDPYMQLLVDLAWAEGQVYRSYTILLDPPNYQLSIVKHQLNNIVKRQYDAAPSSTSSAKSNTTYSQVERAPSSTAIEAQNGATYGPTLANETIWQIAQHYKTSDISLQQIILAIVGTNPQAFTEGNLNGLKDASRLQIPAGSIISKVPVSLARFEVLAHDKAWQTRTPIEHALLPPYIDTAAPTSGNDQQKTDAERLADHSEIPSTPTFSSSNAIVPSTRFLPLVSSLLSVGEDSVTPSGDAKNKAAVTQQARLHADMDIAAAAIASVREVNALLIEQLRTLQSDNKRLHQQLAKRNQEMTKLRNKINLLMARQGVAGQVSKESVESEKNSIWPWFLFLLVLGGCGFFYWRFWIRPKSEPEEDLAADRVTPPIEPVVTQLVEETQPIIDEQQSKVPVTEQGYTDDNRQSLEAIEPVEDKLISSENNKELIEDRKEPIEPIPVENEPAVSVEPEISASEGSSQVEPEVPDVEEKLEIATEPVEAIEPADTLPTEETSQKDSSVNEIKDEHMLDFELEAPGAKIDEKEEKTAEITTDPVEQDKKDDNSIEFVLNPVEETPTATEPIQPVKSKAALETLLALAKTYIGMDDIEAARQSLQEVLDFGNEKQKSDAKKLLDELDKK